MSSRHSISFDEDVSVMSDNSVRNQIPFAVALLGITALLGSAGNLLVLCVYTRKTDKQTASLFILVLALADFHTCTIIIPFTMTNELMVWRIGSNILCKTYYVLNASSVPFSSLIISAIAVDRFLCICYPFLRAMTVQRAKALVIVLAIISLSLGSLAAWFAHMYIEPLKMLGNETASNGTITTQHPIHENHVDPQPECTSKTPLTPSQNVFYIIIQKANHVSFAVCIICVLVLYILIYRRILQVRRRRDKLTGLRFKTTPNNNFEGPSTSLDSSKLTNNNSQMSQSSALRLQRDSNQLLQNMKTAMMLFVVAVVFIVTFVPALLMASDLLPLNLIGFYLYYLNSAANPLIYGFMNPNFRSDVRQLLHISKEPQNMLLRPKPAVVENNIAPPSPCVAFILKPPIRETLL